MVGDPFYEAIVDRLSGALDPNLFEACAVDLLRKEFPTLVPIRGGDDAGMDGAIADGLGEPYPLVSTTSPRVIRNLTNNLDSYLSKGGTRRRVVVATSQPLGGQKRRNLHSRARDMGFELVQIYEQAALASRLYASPRWHKELLGLTGAASALSAIPLTERPLLSLEIVGREEELAWLRESNGDRLLVGPSGSGKTYLLRTLVLEGWGLFLVDDDPTETANAIRSLNPRVVIVDDAHVEPARIIRLRQLRKEIDGDFSIVATSWKGEEDPVAKALNLSGSQILKLALLSRDEIVKVVAGSGVRGPTWLVREIVDQAEGRPGLAVTLSQLCLQGGVRDVALGEHIMKHTVTTFERYVGPETTQILAAFALGGNAGMPQTVVSSGLGVPIGKLNAAVTRLAVGGVIDRARPMVRRFFPDAVENRHTDEDLSIRPPNLRYALVRDVFFGDLPPLPYESFLEAAPDASEAARTLVRAAGYGAKVPPDLLLSTLKRAGSSAPWDEYASLGAEQANWVLDNHPESLTTVAGPALMWAPEATIPLLLDAAVGDQRPLNQFLDHSLRVLADWVKAAEPGSDQAISRRRLLIEGASAWLAAGGDEEVGLRALCVAMSPNFERGDSDPGSGRQFTLSFGLLLPEELSELQESWNGVFDSIKALDRVAWKYLFNLVRDWAYPTTIVPSVEALIGDMQRFAGVMLSDIATIAGGHPGVLHTISDMTRQLKCELDLTLDEEFEILFRSRDFNEDVQTSHERQVEEVRELAVRWSSSSPAKIARRIRELETFGAEVGITSPIHTRLLCKEIAERVQSPGEWLEAFLRDGSTPHMIAPFLHKAAETNERDWQTAAYSCLEVASLRGVALTLVLTLPAPPQPLLTAALAELEGYSNIVEWMSAAGNIPVETLASLLGHDDPEISGAAAIGEWLADPKGQIRDNLLPKWRAAIVNVNPDEYELGNILRADPPLAHDWLSRQIEKDSWIGWRDPSSFEQAVSVLNRAQRLSLLRSLKQKFVHQSVAVALVGDDLDLYAGFLQDDEMTAVHLFPLAGRPTGLWPERAKLAMEAGFSAEKVGWAAYASGQRWEDSESAMWRDWEQQFATLCSHEHAGIRSAAEVGRAYAHRRYEEARERERLEAIYGR